MWPLITRISAKLWGVFKRKGERKASFTLPPGFQLGSLKHNVYYNSPLATIASWLEWSLVKQGFDSSSDQLFFFSPQVKGGRFKMDPVMTNWVLLCIHLDKAIIPSHAIQWRTSVSVRYEVKKTRATTTTTVFSGNSSIQLSVQKWPKLGYFLPVRFATKKMSYHVFSLALALIQAFCL